MIQFFNPADQVFLNGMATIQTREQTAQQQLTTGLKINSASDDPGDLSNLMQVDSSLSETQQITSNLGRVTTETNTAEGALENAVSLLENVSTLATEAQPTSQTATTRSQIAGDVGSDLQQLVALANTNVEGRYVFSGDDDQTQPYTVDLTQASPVSAYAGAAATRQIQSADGSVFAVSQTAQQIFDSSDLTTNVFQTVSGLYTALQNNDQAGINQAITNLSSASTYLNGSLAFYGTTQDRITSATTFAANLTTELQTEQSGIQDANLTASITNLNQAATQQQAALEAEQQVPRKSLFDYLG
jgi:flagellar hook-associated protein 3 FlgL